MPPSEESPPTAEKMNGSASPERRQADTLRPISPSSAGSDNNGGERPVREKLKKASIGGLSQAAAAEPKSGGVKPTGEKSTEATDIQDSGSKEDTLPRGRATRKRSFDDLQNDSATTSDPNAGEDTPRRANHKRLRSRDVSGASDSSNEKSTREHVETVAEEEDDEEARESPGGAGIIVDAPEQAAKAPSGEKSPQKKRSRDQFDKDGSITEGASKDDKQDTDAPTKIAGSKIEGSTSIFTPSLTKGEPEKKRHRDATQDTDGPDDQTQTQPETQLEDQTQAKPLGKPNPAQAATSSSTSETIAKTTKKPPETSDAAFAASGLAAFASKSPFGSFGGAKTGSTSGFGSFGSGKPVSTGFGSKSAAGAPSPFVPKGSGGFGGLGSSTGFGGLGTSTFGSGGLGKSSFASPSSFGSTGPSLGSRGGLGSAKGFGKSDDEDEDDDEEESGIQTVSSGEVQDSRFQAQQMETGEEFDETLFSSRAKLYFFEKKEWKERGAGIVKLNRQLNLDQRDDDEDRDDDDREEDEEAGGPTMVTKARLLMRTDGAHRVILNNPIQKGLTYGSPYGGEPTGKRMQFSVSGGEQPGTYMLLISREDDAKELYHQITLLQSSMT